MENQQPVDPISHTSQTELVAALRSRTTKSMEQWIREVQEVDPRINALSLDHLKDNLISILTAMASTLADQSKSSVTLLTEREREVLTFLSEGSSTKEIAKKLHISPKTVETHRRSLTTKLQIDSVAQLTKYAIRAGITQL